MIGPGVLLKHGFKGNPTILTSKIRFPFRGRPFLALLRINDILEVPILVAFQSSKQST